MLSRGLALTLTIGGVIGSTFPTSAKRVNSALDQLRTKTSQDRDELRALQSSMKGLDKSTQEYTETLDKVNALKSSLGDAGEEIRDLTVSQRDLDAQSEHTERAFGKIQLAVGVATGVLAGMGAVIYSTTNRIKELTSVYASTGTSIGELEKKHRKLSVLLGDSDLASAAIQSLEELNFRAKSLDFSALRPASLAGLDTGKLTAGNLSLEDIRKTLAKINKEGNDFARRNLGEVLGQDLLAAVASLPEPGSIRARLAESVSKAGQLDPKTVEGYRLFSSHVELAKTSVKSLGIELSTGLLPLASKAASSIASVVTWFTSLSDTVRSSIGGVGLFVVATVGLGIAIRGVAFAISGLQTGIALLTGSWKLVTAAQTRSTVAAKLHIVTTKAQTVATKSHVLVAKSHILITWAGTAAIGARTLAAKALTVAIGIGTAATRTNIVATKAHIVTTKAHSLATGAGTVAAGARTAAQAVLTGSMFASVAGFVAATTSAIVNTATTVAGTVATGIRTFAQVALTASMFASVAGFIAATVAAIGFNVAPAGVLIAVGAIITGVVLLVKNWDKVKSAIRSVWASIPGPAKTALSFIFPIVGVIRLIVINLDTLKSVFSRVFGSILKVIQPVWNIVKGIGKFLGLGGLRGLGGGGKDEDSEPAPSPSPRSFRSTRGTYTPSDRQEFKGDGRDEAVDPARSTLKDIEKLLRDEKKSQGPPSPSPSPSPLPSQAFDVPGGNNRKSTDASSSLQESARSKSTGTPFDRQEPKEDGKDEAFLKPIRNTLKSIEKLLREEKKSKGPPPQAFNVLGGNSKKSTDASSPTPLDRREPKEDGKDEALKPIGSMMKGIGELLREEKKPQGPLPPPPSRPFPLPQSIDKLLREMGTDTSSNRRRPRGDGGEEIDSVSVTSHFTINGATNPEEVAKKVVKEQNRRAGQLVEARKRRRRG